MRVTRSPWKAPNTNSVKAAGKAGRGAWSLGKTCATARPPSRAANSSRRPTWRSRMQALDLRGEFRDHVEKITDDSIVRHLEDRCVFVLVDRDRKSTRLNSSHSQISYAAFCLKKKKKQDIDTMIQRKKKKKKHQRKK